MTLPTSQLPHASAKITVQASIIHQIIKVAHHKVVEPPLIRLKLHADTVKVEKLIAFLDEQLNKNGLARSHLEGFDLEKTLGRVFLNYLFDIRSLKFSTFYPITTNSFPKIQPWQMLSPVPPDPNEDQAVVSSETIDQTRYRRITNVLTYALHHHVYASSMTTGDHLPMIFYKENGIEYFYIALLGLTEALTIDEQTGEIIDTDHIDASNLKVACKINITELQNHKHQSSNSNFSPSNYIAWVQKGTTEKIAEYIQDFLPVRIRLDDTEATTKLMKSLNNYLDTSPFSEIAQKEIRNEVLQILSHKAKNKESVNIFEEIDPIIATKSSVTSTPILDKDSFKSFRENNGYGPNDENNSNIFAPAAKPLKNYESFTFSLNDDDNLSLKGSRDLLGEDVKLIESGDSAFIQIKISPEKLPSIKREFD